jgi:hypothetical protein
MERKVTTSLQWNYNSKHYYTIVYKKEKYLCNIKLTWSIWFWECGIDLALYFCVHAFEEVLDVAKKYIKKYVYMEGSRKYEQ